MQISQYTGPRTFQAEIWARRWHPTEWCFLVWTFGSRHCLVIEHLFQWGIEHLHAQISSITFLTFHLLRSPLWFIHDALAHHLRPHFSSLGSYQMIYFRHKPLPGIVPCLESLDFDRGPISVVIEMETVGQMRFPWRQILSVETFLILKIL